MTGFLRFALMLLTATAEALRSGTAASSLQQASGESREECVRKHWQRPGVVANGVTLVDLYDRIRVLEERLGVAEQRPAPPPPG